MTTNPAWIVARAQLRRTGLPMIAGYWAIMLPVYAIILALVIPLGDPRTSIWATSGGSAPKYFLAAMGVMITTVFLPIYVGNGVTRRHFALGATAYLAVLAVIFAVPMVLGYGVEHAVYSANDLLALQTDPYPVRSVGDGFETFLEEFCVGGVYVLGGWLVGSCFYRYGVWAIASLPVALVPVAVAEMGFNSLWLGHGLDNVLGIDPRSWIGIPIAVACGAALWIANYALVRGMAIKKVSG
jgi:hypothetical protein